MELRTSPRGWFTFAHISFATLFLFGYWWHASRTLYRELVATSLVSTGTWVHKPLAVKTEETFEGGKCGSIVNCSGRMNRPRSSLPTRHNKWSHWSTLLHAMNGLVIRELREAEEYSGQVSEGSVWLLCPSPTVPNAVVTQPVRPYS